MLSLRRLHLWVRVLPVLLVLWSETLWAVEFANCEAGFRAIVNPDFGSSVELEMVASPGVLKSLTTRTGKLDAIADDIQLREFEPPRNFARRLANRITGNDEVETLMRGLRVKNLEEFRAKDWDSLSPKQQMKVLQFAAKKKKTTFFADRKMPGMRVRDKVTLTFARETEFLGKKYPPGTHEVNLEGAMGKVEYANHDQTPDYVELHLRARMSSGLVSNDARVFQQAIGANVTHQHVHIVAPLPLEKLRAEPRLQPARMAEYFRRMNLVTEMMTIVENGGGIYPNIIDGITYFDNMPARNLIGVTEYLEKIAAGKNPAIGDQYKIGWVGFRGSDKYDQPGLYGFEFREIGARANPTTTRKLLSSAQYAMLKDDYGIPAEKIAEWLEKHHKDKLLSSAIDRTWYSQAPGDIYEVAPERVKMLFATPEEFEKFMGAKNKAARMLGYDWSKDPLLFDKPELAEMVLGHQTFAIQRIRDGASTEQAIKEFLKESGLYELFTKSVGG